MSSAVMDVVSFMTVESGELGVVVVVGLSFRFCFTFYLGWCSTMVDCDLANLDGTAKMQRQLTR
jgi:hypothetical protein